MTGNPKNVTKCILLFRSSRLTLRLSMRVTIPVPKSRIGMISTPAVTIREIFILRLRQENTDAGKTRGSGDASVVLLKHVRAHQLRRPSTMPAVAT